MGKILTNDGRGSCREDYKDIGSLSREFSNVPEDVLASVIDFATLPTIERSADGRLVAKK